MVSLPNAVNGQAGRDRSRLRWAVSLLGLTVVTVVCFIVLYADDGLTASHPHFAENFNAWMIAQCGTLPLTLLVPLIVGGGWARAMGREPEQWTGKRLVVVGCALALTITVGVFVVFMLTGAAFTVMLESALTGHAITWARYKAEVQSVLVDPVACQRMAIALAWSTIGGSAIGLALDYVCRSEHSASDEPTDSSRLDGPA